MTFLPLLGRPAHDELLYDRFKIFISKIEDDANEKKYNNQKTKVLYENAVMYYKKLFLHKHSFSNKGLLAYQRYDDKKYNILQRCILIEDKRTLLLFLLIFLDEINMIFSQTDIEKIKLFLQYYFNLGDNLIVPYYILADELNNVEKMANKTASLVHIVSDFPDWDDGTSGMIFLRK